MSGIEMAKAVVQKMFDNDAYSQWLGISLQEIGIGTCRLSLQIRKEMLNGFSVAHGSITFALADSALAFASNSHGRKSVSIDTQISHLKPCFEEDVITALATEMNRSRKLARYNIEIRNQKNDLVAHFLGTVFIKDEMWEV